MERRAFIGRECTHGFCSPEVNACLLYTAPDSDDRGILWACRYGRRKEWTMTSIWRMRVAAVMALGAAQALAAGRLVLQVLGTVEGQAVPIEIER